MPLLSATGVRKDHGGEAVLLDLDLVVEDGDRIGVIGPNGCGKSTLLRILAGVDAPDQGSLAIAHGIRTGYLPQDPGFDPSGTPVAAALEALDHLRCAEEELRRLEAALAQETDALRTEALLERHARIQEGFERQGGYAREARAREVLAAVGLPPDRHEQPTSTLSGGERCRVALARVLLSGADLLLLDEPTNHLDLAGLEWLETELVRSARALLVISHDRRFLDRVATRILAFTAEGPRLHSGNFSTTEALRRAEALRRRVEYERQQDFVRKEKEFIRRHLGSQRSQEAKGRRKRLERLTLIGRPPSDPLGLRLDLSPARKAGEKPLVVSGLACARGERVLFRGLDLVLEPGERLGVAGANGTGKSTLLLTLTGRLPPAAGRVDLGRNVDVGVFDQERAPGPAALTVQEAVRSVMPRWSDQELRSFLARLLFFGDEIERPLGVLSGGEAARLDLGLLLLRRPNLLVLDEPTNHLDIPARAALEELLLLFSGTLIIVSHDRHFLDRVTRRTLWIEAAGPRILPHPYSEAMALMRQEAARGPDRETGPASRRPAARSGRPPPRPAAARKSLPALEREIIALETEREGIHQALADPALYADGERIRAVRARLASIDQALAPLYADWESRAGPHPS
jgi:ATP-binding cassette subfamily F protein 3